MVSTLLPRWVRLQGCLRILAGAWRFALYAARPRADRRFCVAATAQPIMNCRAIWTVAQMSSSRPASAPRALLERTRTTATRWSSDQGSGLRGAGEW